MLRTGLGADLGAIVRGVEGFVNEKEGNDERYGMVNVQSEGALSLEKAAASPMWGRDPLPSPTGNEAASNDLTCFGGPA